MSKNNIPITIDYDSATNTYHHYPSSNIDIDLDDTVTFKVITARGCCVCFRPINVFGPLLQLVQGDHGPYAPSIPTSHPVEVHICVTDINATCTPPTQRIRSYSIKVG